MLNSGDFSMYKRINVILIDCTFLFGMSRNDSINYDIRKYILGYNSKYFQRYANSHTKGIF